MSDKNPTALYALELAHRAFQEALPKFDWGASALDANAIDLLNRAPLVVARALDAAAQSLLVSEPTPVFKFKPGDKVKLKGGYGIREIIGRIPYYLVTCATSPTRAQPQESVTIPQDQLEQVHWREVPQSAKK